MIVGVVPAAGRAGRLRGLIDGSKELVRVDGRPLIDHLLERLAVADELRVVVRPAKHDLIEHLEGRATVVVGEPPTVSASLALGLAGLAEDDVVLVGFPDTLFGPEDAFALLVEALRGRRDVVLGAFTFAEPSRSDVVWGCLAARRGALERIDRYPEPGLLLDELAHAGRVAAVRFPGELVDLGTPESLAAAR